MADLIMTHPLPNLTWLRSFESAAQHLNFTHAAHELGLTQAAISLHIRSLEDRLGTSLFHRHPRNLQLTEMGKAYFPAVRKALEDLSLSTSGLFGPKLKKAVSLRAPISTCVLLIAPRLQQFHARFSDIDVRMISSVWADRLSEVDVDIDLQLGIADRFPRNIELLCDETITPICHKDRAVHYPVPSDLLDAPLIHILGFEDHWSRYFSAYGLDPEQAQYSFSVDTTVAALEMISAGLGIAPVLTKLGDQALRSNRPIAKLQGPIALEQSHFLAELPSSGKERPEVSAFRDWLRNLFVAEPGN